MEEFHQNINRGDRYRGRGSVDNTDLVPYHPDKLLFDRLEGLVLVVEDDSLNYVRNVRLAGTQILSEHSDEVWCGISGDICVVFITLIVDRSILFFNNFRFLRFFELEN